ncbi:hypothetical protein DL96DRAFT_1821202 [Flagelloscypha sp. PMI_526]|nr:hypothetical protein DL96DRAFT_1821202 [Flagelloscypha sp. PMI_526]
MSSSTTTTSVIPGDSSVEFVGDGRFCVIQVEQTLFRLPVQHLCDHMRFFETPLSLPGSVLPTDDNPLPLHDVAATTFISALEWLFRLSYSNSLGKEDWIRVFRFAQAYEVERLEQDALEELKACSWEKIEKLQFCERYNVPFTWAADELATLATSTSALKIEDYRRLHPRTLCLIYALGSNSNGSRVSKAAVLQKLPSLLALTAPVRDYSLDHPHDPLTSSEGSVLDPPKLAATQVSRHPVMYFSDRCSLLEIDGLDFIVYQNILALHTSHSRNRSSESFIFVSKLAAQGFLQWIHRKIDLKNRNQYDVDGWIELLQLSHRANVPRLKTICLSHLKELTMPPARRIQVCDENAVSLTWATGAFFELCSKDIRPSLDTFRTLSSATFVRLLDIREAFVAAIPPIAQTCVHGYYARGCYSSDCPFYRYAQPPAQPTMEEVESMLTSKIE